MKTPKHTQKLRVQWAFIKTSYNLNVHQHFAILISSMRPLKNIGWSSLKQILDIILLHPNCFNVYLKKIVHLCKHTITTLNKIDNNSFIFNPYSNFSYRLENNGFCQIGVFKSRSNKSHLYLVIISHTYLAIWKITPASLLVPWHWLVEKTGSVII